MRQTIISNATEYIETNHNENTESDGYAELATEMCQMSMTQKGQDWENEDTMGDKGANMGDKKAGLGK